VRSGARARRMARPSGPHLRAVRHTHISVGIETLSPEMTRTELPVLPTPRAGLVVPDVSAATASAALLSDRTRSAILGLLRTGPHCVCEMAAATGERENNVSNHLARLRAAGLVRASRHRVDARWIYYERDEAACAAALAELAELLT
jgi:DNA-binding transcriptional ArsR family regulator